MQCQYAFHHNEIVCMTSSSNTSKSLIRGAHSYSLLARRASAAHTASTPTTCQLPSTSLRLLSVESLMALSSALGSTP